MKKSLFLTCFVMLCSLVFGQNHWTVNDALYENSMSLLAKVTVGNETAANAEIAAFYDDEVRGVGKTDANGKVFLTIFGSDREQITFKIYDGEKVYASKYTVEFETNAANTSPVTVDFYEIHWNYEPNYDLYKSMTIVGKIHIDGVPQTGDNFELAVFYNDSLRGVARPDNGIVYLYIPGHGHENKPFEFKLYDGTRELVSDLRDLNVIFVNNKYDGTLDAPKPLNFITKPYVAQIGEVRYQSLAKAFAEATDDDVITMIDNVTEVVNITKTEAVTLDLASYTLTGSILAPNAKLTVENGNIINKDRNVSAIEINAGELALNNVNISSARHAVRIDGAVKATINGGEYTLNATSGTRHAVNVSGAAEVTIKAGTFKGPKGTTMDSGSAVNVQSGATVTIEGGDFSGGKNATLGVSGTMVLTGGTYDQDVTQYCAEGYICEFNTTTSKYEVIEGLKGKGTEAEPFIIKNLKDLTFFRNSVNAGQTKYNAPGVWVALGADIDMDGTTWQRGIGDGINATFDGIFDGKNYTIKNLTMNPEADTDGYVCGGLFGYTYGAATIQNLTLENVAITTQGSGHNVGALVGFANNNGGKLTVTNVTVKGVVKIDAPKVHGVGAIVGYSYRTMGTISNCTVDANDGSYIKGYSFVGGITGYSYSNAIISGCTVKNIGITATNYSAGGVAGIVLDGNKVSGCTVENVTVAAQANYASVVGAIAANGIVVENCTAAEPMVGGNYSDSKPVQARIGNKYYATLATAIEVAQATETITIANNINLDAITIATGKTVNLDLYGYTVAGTDNGTASYGLFTNKGNLTIKDTKGNGKITLAATKNRGWNAYSSVISNTVGGKLTVNGGTIEHLGGTDMAYGIDNLTNGKNTYAETVINGGTVKSTYRAVRQFLNGVEARNILTVNGGTIEGANKSIWMQDPSANANSGKLTVGESASLKGDAYLTVTAGSTDWPVEVSIAAAALKDGAKVLSTNVPAKYQVKLVNGYYTIVEIAPAAKIGDEIYYSLAAAIDAATNGQTITLLRDVNENVTIEDKKLTLDGAGFNSKGTISTDVTTAYPLTFQNFNIEENASYFVKVIGGGGNYYFNKCNIKNSDYGLFYANRSTNIVSIKESTIEGCGYAVNFTSCNTVTLEKVTMTYCKYGIFTQNKGVRTFNVKECNIEAEYPICVYVTGTALQTFNFEGENTLTGEVDLSNYGKLVLTKATSTLKAEADLDVKTTVEGCTVTYQNGVYSVVPANVENTNTGKLYGTIQAAINDAANGDEIKLLKDINYTLADAFTTTAGYKVLVDVEGKDITLDMAGKTISVNHPSTAANDRIYAVICVEDGAGLTVTGNGTIDVITDDTTPRVAYMFWKRGETGHLTIENGSFHMNNSEDSIVYTNGNEIVTVKGGTFILDAVGTRVNGFPWAFNTSGNCSNHIIVIGGEYNYDINHQHWTHEVYVPVEKALIEEAGLWKVVDAEAYVVEFVTSCGNIRNVGYATLEEAFAVAMEKDRKDVVLVNDVVLENTLTVNAGEQIVLDLNGKVVSGTCNAGQSSLVFVENTASLTVKDTVGTGKLTYAQGTSNTGWAIDLEGKLTLESGTIELTGDSWSIGYAVDVRPNSWGSEYTEGTTFTMNGGKLVSSDGAVRVASSSAAAHENVSASFVMNDGTIDAAWDGVFVQQSDATYDVLSFTMNGGTIKSALNPVRVYGPAATGYVNGQDCMNIAFNAGTMTYTGTEAREWIIEDVLRVGGGSTIETILESGDITASATFAQNNELPRGYGWEETAGVFYAVKLEVAMINETGVIYSILQDAFDAAQNGQTITVLEDIDLTEGVTVAADKVVTLDLNRKTVTGTPTEAKAYAVITNNGNLTVKNGSIICDHKLAGSTGYAVNAITNGGTLTIDGATVENNSTAQYQIGYAIDNNSTTGNAVVVVKSGAVRASGSYYYDGIRQFCNSLTNENDVTIEDGEVSTLWMQNPSDGNGSTDKNTKDVKGSFAIKGGKVGVVSTEPSANFTASITAGEISSVGHFQTAAGRDLVGYITGGTFGMDVTKPFCHEDYSAILQANNTWVVEQTAGTLTRKLINGWSWFSSYIDIEGSYGFGLLTDALGASAEQIKEGKNNQAPFAQYSTTSGWYGNLKATSSKKMYQIKTIEDVEVNIHGKFFDVKEYKPILNKGWNYLSYPHTKELDIATALQEFSPVDNDLIKTLDGSMLYWEDLDMWIASGINKLVPGVGYMYQSNDQKIKQVSYTTEVTRSTAKAYVSESPEHWTVGAAQYPNNMTMIATLDVEGGDYEVAAFVNGELRGSVRPIYIEELNQYIMVMTILGEEVADVTFKYYDFNTEEEYDLNNVVIYSDNAILGSTKEPYALTRGTTSIGEATLSNINIYPNPTTTDREINLQATCDKVEVFNTLGVKVAEYQNVDSIDALETAGTYVIRVTLNGDVKHCRLVVK